MFTSPYDFFESWFRLAVEAKLPQHDSMILATATRSAKPSARVVLLKGIVDGEFRFFTNYDSRKAAELKENPQAQLLFYWPQFGHQIRIEGAVHLLDTQASDEYWFTRSRDSRIGAIASKQSRPLGSMDELRARVKEVEKQYDGSEVLRPANWGGFGLKPDRFEFWKDGEFRLHERIVYERSAPDSEEWVTSRLFP